MCRVRQVPCPSKCSQLHEHSQFSAAFRGSDGGHAGPDTLIQLCGCKPSSVAFHIMRRQEWEHRVARVQQEIYVPGALEEAHARHMLWLCRPLGL